MIDDALEITVDGVSYKYSQLGEAARAQVANLQFVEAEIARLNSMLAVMQTAKNAYNSALNELLPRTTQ
ncbi:MAG: hypothetical protein V4723_16335 [Pseudomonadota bacterium]